MSAVGDLPQRAMFSDFVIPRKLRGSGPVVAYLAIDRATWTDIGTVAPENDPCAISPRNRIKPWDRAHTSHGRNRLRLECADSPMISLILNASSFECVIAGFPQRPRRERHSAL
jgi:hypothetical protein